LSAVGTIIAALCFLASANFVKNYFGIRFHLDGGSALIAAVLWPITASTIGSWYLQEHFAVS
jgi:hypothetical protein